MSKQRLLALLPLGLVLLCQAEPAFGGMRFDPVHLHLTREQPTTMLKIGNSGEKPMRYQVTIFAWSQGPAGEIVTEPTADIAFFPTVFELKPHQERSVRLGAKTAFSDKEKTYRLFIEEFAPPGDSAGAGLQVRARVGLPLFLDPPAPDDGARVIDVQPAEGGVAVRLRSTGNIHRQLLGARAEAVGADGRTLHNRAWSPTYLLAGRDLRLAGAMPHERCAEVREVKVDVLTARGTLKGSAATPHGICAP
jgi:P pilus assembly chaperone PapD